MGDSTSQNSPRGSSPHIDDEICVDMLHGLMAGEEAERVLDHVGDCPDCEELFRARVAEFETTRAAARPVRGPDGRWAIEARSVEGGRADLRDESRGGFWRKYFGRLAPSRPLLAAAAVALVAAGILFFGPFRGGVDESPIEFWIPSGREIRELRADDHTADNSIWAGIRAYDEKDVGRAIAALEAAQAEGPHESMRIVYLASAYTLAERYGDALQLLDGLPPTSFPQPWRNDSRWIRYISLSGEGRTDAAAKLLDELSVLDDEVGALARERKRRIEDR